MKYIWWSIGAVVLIGALVLVVILRPMTPEGSMDAVIETDTTNSVEAPASTDTGTDTPSAALASGRYQDYSSDSVDDNGYQTTILFFYAGWCPECRGYDMAIKDGTVPAGTQILKVDYDSSQDLRKQYGVTIQSTFVRVNAAGEKQTLWNGYGKDKSLSAILDNTK
jgi:hypothetical protein